MMRYYLFLIVFSFFSLLFPRVADASTLQFMETKKEIAVGEETSVSIELNPQGAQILGVDIIIFYDPTFVTIKDIHDKNLFSKKTAQIIDSEKGILKVAFANEYGIYVTKKGTVGEIILLGKSETNETFLRYHFIQGETVDSNVTGNRGTDYLQSVNTVALSIYTPSNTSSNLTPIPSVTQAVTLSPTRGQGRNRILTPTKSPVSQSILGAESEEDPLLETSIGTDQVQEIKDAEDNLLFIIAIALVLLIAVFGLFYFAIKRNKVE